MLRFLISAAAIAVITAQCPAIPSTGCNICPDGECVQTPDAVFEFPGQPPVPCGMLQDAGINGIIPLDSCPELATVTGICGCAAGPVFTGNGCPSVPSGGCNICGDSGTCVQNADAIFTFPEQPSAPCGALQAAGLNGMIPLESCPYMPEIVGVCECGTPGSAPAPTPGPPLAPAPSAPAPPASAPNNGKGGMGMGKKRDRRQLLDRNAAAASVRGGLK